MKIKYIDKLHKKFKDDPMLDAKIAMGAGLSILAAAMLTIFIGGHMLGEELDIKREIIETPYVIENNESYKLKDIYILYKDNDIRICRREDVLKSVSSGYDLAQSITIGTLISDSSYDYLYKFYDIKTNEVVAACDYGIKSSEELYSQYAVTRDDTKELNGYEYFNLGDKIKVDGYKDHDKIDQEYIDDYIENKRFLGR